MEPYKPMGLWNQRTRDYEIRNYTFINLAHAAGGTSTAGLYSDSQVQSLFYQYHMGRSTRSSTYYCTPMQVGQPSEAPFVLVDAPQFSPPSCFAKQ